MSFCTAVNCMDGRTQVPVIEYLKRRFGVAYVDMITEPGINQLLAMQQDAVRVEAVLTRCDISVEKHRSVGIAVVGHHDCAGNPAPENEQHQHIRQAVMVLAGRYPQLEVIGLWVDADWQVHELSSRSSAF